MNFEIYGIDTGLEHQIDLSETRFDEIAAESWSEDLKINSTEDVGQLCDCCKKTECDPRYRYI